MQAIATDHPVQAIAVAIVLALSLAYAVYRLRQTYRQANDPCAGCEGCALKNAGKARKEGCQEKKVGKKFGSLK